MSCGTSRRTSSVWNLLATLHGQQVADGYEESCLRQGARLVGSLDLTTCREPRATDRMALTGLFDLWYTASVLFGWLLVSVILAALTTRLVRD
jgi:hypothetical protein